MRRWNLRGIETPAGKRSPVVLHSSEEARAVLVTLEPGEELGVEAGDESVDAGVGELLAFEPDERRTISSTEGARLLLFLAPWPGEGHYRGDKLAGS